MARDYRLILAARLLRALGFGTSAVLVGVQLERRGLTPAGIGLVLAIGLLSAAISGLLAATASVRWGRRATLAAIGVLMALTGIDLAFATWPLLLGAAGLTGMLGAASIDLGPHASIEQAALAETVAPGARNLAFARYSLTGGLAVAAGGLIAAWASDLTRGQLLFLLYAAIGVVTALLALLLSSGSEGALRSPTFNRSQIRSLGPLSALFAVDAFGGGLVINAVIAFWLHVRFGAPLSVLGPAFAAIALVQAASYEVAGRLSNRIGLIRTMVFTHIPSNVLLVLVPFSPTLPVALGVLIARFCISQMDVPARQAYVVSIVPPTQRAGALAVTGTVRGVAQSIGPVLSGAAIQASALGLPFYLAGGLKLIYDVGLYLGFRGRRAGHERT